MASGEYTFYPKFSEFVTLYRGVVRVWIADGTSLNPGTSGVLYAEYIDGLVQELGYVSDYETAKQYFADLGITLTYPEWVAILANTPKYRDRAEAWAVGKVLDVPVESNDETYHNNARYYADQSKIWTTGSNLDGQSIQPNDNATFWNNEAHGWANNKEAGAYSATNNSKYWAEQSKEFTNGKDLSDTAVPARATDNAEYFKNEAKLWANNGTQGSSPNATNNAKYWAEQSKEYTNGKDLFDQVVVERETDNAVYFKNQAKLWANNGTDGETPSATNNSKYYSENSEESNKQAESWAKGTRGGQPDNVRQNAATDNASYYNEQSKLWANNGTDGDTPSASNNAKAYSEDSNEFERQSESWAQGTRDGVADDIRQDAATKNSKAYCDKSKMWANYGTDGDEPSSSNNAKAYSADSNEFERQSESWAKGTRDGVADNVRQNAATDNSKAYSEVSRNWANFSTDGDTPTASNNAKAYSEDSNEFERQSESWAKGTRDGIADTERANAATDNSYYYSEESKKWANFGTDGATPSATNNAKAYANDSETSAQNSEESNKQSESWAKGTRDGQPDTERTNASTDNSLYYSEQSKLWANFGTDGSTPSSSNNAKEYAHQAQLSATAAGASESSAAGSASTATTKASEASASAQAAAASESNAATSESNAAASETNAAASESNASTSESNAHNSEVAAAQSESDAAQHKTDAETAQAAAEEAQRKAEVAISRTPRINSSDNWEVWNIEDEQWEDTGHKSMAEATIEYDYQNSTSGTVPPTGTWTVAPQPEPGRYMWIRMKYMWNNGRVDYFYNVGYIGANGTGSVNSVNGMGGDVILDGTGLYIDDNAQTKETIYQAFDRIGTAITNEQIDALFA